MNHLLLVYYHPIIFDLAESFLKIFNRVTIACNASLKDNYGEYAQVAAKIKANPHLQSVDCIPLSVAHLKIKDYDIVGCDGVFDGDELIMEVCKERGVPYFNINGYPHQADEPSQNILAFSWFLPQIQYKQRFPHEGYIKERDWKHIAFEGRSEGKNICVFYPELNEAKRYAFVAQPRPRHKFTSFIHRYEECNRWTYLLFQKFELALAEKHIFVGNYSGKTQKEVFDLMSESYGVVHLKHGDCPGISILESLILKTPVITMSSFVKASFNQDVLIDNQNAIIADDFDELIERSIDAINKPWGRTGWDHIYGLTNFNRQRNKLERFFHGCMIHEQ